MSEPAWTISALLALMAARGEQPALIAVRGGVQEVWSHSRVADHAYRLAAGLVAAGVAPGDPIALFGPNSPAWVVARLAIGACGAVAAAIDDLASDAEAAAIIADAGCRHGFVTEAHLAAMRAMPGGADLLLWTLDGEESSAWTGLLAADAGDLPAVAGSAPALLVHTSGTTGRPKSFALSYDNLAANIQAILAQGQLGPADRMLLPLPLHHVYPLVVGLLTPLTGGAAVVFPQAPTGPEIVRALTVARASVLAGVPRLHAALLSGLEGRFRAQGRLIGGGFDRAIGLSLAVRRRFGINIGRIMFAPVRARLGPALKLLVSGGAHLDPVVIERLEALGWIVQSGYGLAETASIFTGNVPNAHRHGSEGRPLGLGLARIGEPGPDGSGEIQLRGPNVFAGYRKNPEANQTAFTADGWFRTGDLGRIDSDGFIYVTGRLKEMIVLGGGKNIFPEEIETVLGESPYLREIAVLEREGALVALVVPDLDRLHAEGLTQIEAAVRVSLTGSGQRLPNWQRLAGFAIARAPLPRTRFGKLQRFRLPELYEQVRRGGGRTPAVAAWSEADRALLRDPTAAAVWALLQARYPERAIDLDANPQLDLGIDSLEALALAMALENQLGLRVPETALGTAGSLREVLTLAMDHRGAASTAPPVRTTDQRDWLAPPGALWRRLGGLVHALNRQLMQARFALTTRPGLPPEPPPGGFVLVANHASDLDPMILAAAMPLSWRRRLRWAGDIERVFGPRWRHPLLHGLRVFPVDEQSPAAALAAAKAVLARGDGLVWFPESWRSPDGRLQAFLPGIGHIVAACGVPVIPAWIEGSFAAWPRDRRWPSAVPIEVRFGAAITAARLNQAGAGDTPETRIVSALHQAVTALSIS